jgi:hypothetical protein
MSTATAEKPKIVGKTEPRLFTPPLPENVNPLTGEIRSERTHGHAAIAFAEELLHMRLFPWQKWLLIHALELVPNPDGPGDLYRFRTVIVMVARQNGKTTIEVVLALWHIYALESGTVIGTAQDLDNAGRAWKDAVALAESDDELAELIEDIYQAHPKCLTLSNGCEYRIAAAHRRGARGFPGDLILLDELREQQNWDSWAAVTNTMNARPKAQAWAFSNAGDALSVVLRYLRALAHKELGWPDGDDDKELLEEGGTLDMFADMDIDELPEGWDELTTGFFEWSASPTAKRSDMEALAQANPSTNHFETTPNCPTPRTLLSHLKTDPPGTYDMEVLCRFVALAEGGPFPEGSWAATLKPEARPADEAQRVVCVEVSSRRDQTYIARTAFRDGIAVLGMWQDKPGTDWVGDFLLENIETIDAIVFRTESGSPSLTLYDDLSDEEKTDSRIVEKLVEWKGADIGTGHSDMFDRLRDRTIEHLPHKPLDMAATSAAVVKSPAGGWRVDIRNSPTDTAPLLAGMGAVWGLENVPDAVSMYANEEVFVL